MTRFISSAGCPVPDPSNFKITLDNTKELSEALLKLAKTQVMVGIPENDAPRTEGLMTNAALGYIHEHGSPAQGIPPRPWLVPGVSESKNQWMSYIQQAAKLAMDGNSAGMDKALNAAGITAVNAIKNRVVAGVQPPLAPATIRARRRRSKGSNYRRLATVAQDTTPLVDTAQMLNSVVYVVRKGK